VVVEKDGVDQLDRSCEKYRSITKSRRGEEKNILHTKIKKRRKASWIGHILCRNCLLKQVIEGKIGERIEVRGRRGRRNRLLNNLKEKEYTGTRKREQ